MAQNVSSVRVAIQGDSRGLNTALENSSRRIQTFSRTSSRSLTSMSGSSFRANTAISQLGFAAEDAATVFGTQGFAGALRASGNNLSFVASSINPLAGAVVGIGTAVAALAINFRDAGDSASDAKEDVDSLAESLRGVRVAQRSLEVEFDIAREVDVPEFAREARGFGPEQRQDAMRSLENDLTRARIRTESVQEQVRQSLTSSGLPAQLAGFLEDVPSNLREVVKEHDRWNNTVTDLDLTKLLELKRELIAIDEQAELARQKRSELLDIPAAEPEGSAFGQIADLLGESVSGVIDGAFREAETRLERRRNAIAQDDPLQAGLQFGTADAVSAINRATFGRDERTEQDIEQNTSDTVEAVRDVAEEVGNLGESFSTAISDALTTGSSL